MGGAGREGGAPPTGAPDTEVGLCATCRHARVQESARGSRFWRCALADRDARFLRYPPLPVRECPGHRPAPAREGPERGGARPGGAEEC